MLHGMRSRYPALLVDDDFERHIRFYFGFTSLVWIEGWAAGNQTSSNAYPCLRYRCPIRHGFAVAAFPRARA